MSFTLDQPPAWARSWCYYFFIIASVAAVGVIVAAVGSYKKLGLTSSVILLLAGLVQVTTGMVTFWMCRKSLA